MFVGKFTKKIVRSNVIARDRDILSGRWKFLVRFHLVGRQRPLFENFPSEKEIVKFLQFLQLLSLIGAYFYSCFNNSGKIYKRQCAVTL